MLTHNYHTHTYRCNHASGTEREYIENAIRAGIRELGFSDHSPYSFPGDYYSGFRMRPEALGEYVDTLISLKREYARDINVRIGLEAEYYPGRWQAFLNILKPYPIEYLILGQHFPGDEIGEAGATQSTSDDARLERFTEQMCQGISTGKFSCVAHPDILNYTGSKEVYAREMRKLCKCALAHGVPLEINFLGIRTRRHYPRADFWRVAGETGNQVIYGLDAHDAPAMFDTASYAEAERMVGQYGLNRVETLEFRAVNEP